MHQMWASLTGYLYENLAALDLPSAEHIVIAEKKDDELVVPSIVVSPLPGAHPMEPIYAGFDGNGYVERFRTLVQFEVVTVSDFWLDAMRRADLLQRLLGGDVGKTIPRKTWLLDDGTPNPVPVEAGEIRVIPWASYRPDYRNDDPVLKSIFVTATAEWSRPRPP